MVLCYWRRRFEQSYNSMRKNVNFPAILNMEKDQVNDTDDDLVFCMSPAPLLDPTRKRDSGYGTDFSPASVTQSRTFSYGSPGNDSDVHNLDLNLSNLDLSEKNESEDESDEDREVKELFSNSGDHSVSEPVNIQRPSAPLPTPEGGEEERPTPQEDYLISVPFHHTMWSHHDIRRRGAGKIRPLGIRSIGTQTPSPHSQIIHDVINDRFHPYGVHARGTAFTKLRLRSEGDDDPSRGTHSPLPDIIPCLRDRSVSLPDVPALRRECERRVGRELRRISDDFHEHSLHRVRTVPGSFPLTGAFTATVRFTAWIRRYWTASPRSRGTDNSDKEEES